MHNQDTHCDLKSLSKPKMSKHFFSAVPTYFTREALGRKMEGQEESRQETSMEWRGLSGIRRH